MAQAGGNDRLILARAADMALDVLKTHKTHITDFYDPYHTGLVVSALKFTAGVSYRADGGYPGAERQRVVICPDYLNPEDADSGLVYLSITGSFHGSPPGHRDYLGSLLGLGLKREKLGDVLVNDGGASVIVSAEVAPYITAQLSRVGRWEVSVDSIEAGELKLPEERVKTVSTTVSSLRLDSVAAAGYGVSRSKMADYITSERVNLNWQVKSSPSQTVKEGDIISIRGRGRVEVTAVKGASRGGRIFVELNRYY
ncbi:MAG: YlmH/Sll1252 family protein [Actinobacteria bacterium]|nr:YlmH/Sll1252 family protein [Actinomycetota bacterium]